MSNTKIEWGKICGELAIISVGGVIGVAAHKGIGKVVDMFLDDEENEVEGPRDPMAVKPRKKTKKPTKKKKKTK